MFDGVSWSNPFGDSSTWAGMSGSPGGFSGLMGQLNNQLPAALLGIPGLNPNANSGQAPDIFGAKGFADKAASWGQDAGNTPLGGFVGLKALTGGTGTPWGTSDEKGIQGLSLFNPISALPGGRQAQSDADYSLFQGKPDAPKYDTDPTHYTAPDYSDKLRADNQQVQQNLSRQQNDIVAGSQGRGTLSSGSTGLGLADALAGASNASQGNASNIANMQRNDQYRQMNDANNQAYNSYSSKMNRYGQGMSNIGQAAGLVGAFL
jgi:hypothetical protein